MKRFDASIKMTKNVFQCIFSTNGVKVMTMILVGCLAILWIYIRNTYANIVSIPNGEIMGGTGRTVDGNNIYYYFKGIPYAEPPIGDFRFEPPVPKRSWNEIIDGTVEGNICIQGNDPVIGSEDCLNLNVYTPSLTNRSKPVLVFIHGGGFIYGNTTYQSYGPDYFLDEGFVFVSMNYRLSIFGFVSTGDLASPGNNGLKDQRLALMWVQKNIAHFGGDPRRVTLMGQSAGGASVAYHLQSHRSTGLFQRAIMQSGTTLNLFSLNKRAKETTFNIGDALSISTKNSTELIHELKKIDPTILQSKAFEESNQVFSRNTLAGIPFGPVMEPIHDGAFFTTGSDDLLRKGNFQRVPCLVGVTSNEAASQFVIDVFGDLKMENAQLAPRDLTEDAIRRIEAGNAIDCFYFDCSLNTSSLENKVKFLSDDQFNRPIRRFVLDLSRFISVYFYVLSYEGTLGGIENRTLPGVQHFEDLGYLFRTFFKEVPQNDVLMRKRMVKMWSNFAKYGRPTPQSDGLLQNKIWLPAYPNQLFYMNVDLEMEVSKNIFKDRMDFYDGIYKKFGTPPYDTY